MPFARPYPDSGYAVAGLRPGEWRLRVETSGYRSIHRKITLRASPARVRFDLHMESAAKVAVSLRTPDGKPLRQGMSSRLRHLDEIQIGGTRLLLLTGRAIDRSKGSMD